MRIPVTFLRFLVLVTLLRVTSGATCAFKLRQSIDPPRDWVNRGRASPSQVISLRIALHQPRFSELEQYLAESSNPFHSNYGDHLSKEQVEALVAPHPSSVEAVHEWLESHGIRKEACHPSPAGDWVTLHVPVAQAEKILSTVSHHASLLPSPAHRSLQEFHLWQHAQDGDFLVRTTQYSLPANL